MVGKMSMDLDLEVLGKSLRSGGDYYYSIFSFSFSYFPPFFPLFFFLTCEVL
jgi:hypothetical protein